MHSLVEVLHQWLAFTGIVVSTLGVLVVALEWRFSMYDSLSRLELEQDLLLMARGEVPTRTLEVSQSAKRIIEKTDLSKIVIDNVAFEQFLKNVLILDSVDRLDRRKRVFTFGFALIVGGSIVQMFAAWPN